MNGQPYIKYSVRRLITVRQLATVHYLRNVRAFATQEDAHDFWELVFVDLGAVEVMADGERVPLAADELFLHAPNQRHWLRVGAEPATVFVLSFVCFSEAMGPLCNRVLRVREGHKRVLSRMIDEMKHAFLPGEAEELLLRDIWPNPASPIGAEQMVVNYLEQLLIGLSRAMDGAWPAPAGEPDTDGRLVSAMKAYIRAHLGTPLSVSRIAEQVRYSRAYASEIFKATTGMGIMAYVNRARVEQAKRLLGDGRLTVTEIAQELGFSSVHYFSRRFRQLEGCTPTEYARSLAGRLAQLERQAQAAPPAEGP